MNEKTFAEKATHHADCAEAYREMLSDFGKEQSPLRRQEWRRKMVTHQDACVIYTRLASHQEAR
jgi:hypothetical protein